MCSRDWISAESCCFHSALSTQLSTFTWTVSDLCLPGSKEQPGYFFNKGGKKGGKGTEKGKRRGREEAETFKEWNVCLFASHLEPSSMTLWLVCLDSENRKYELWKSCWMMWEKANPVSLYCFGSPRPPMPFCFQRAVTHISSFTRKPHNFPPKYQNESPWFSKLWDTLRKPRERYF